MEGLIFGILRYTNVILLMLSTRQLAPRVLAPRVLAPRDQLLEGQL